MRVVKARRPVSSWAQVGPVWPCALDLARAGTPIVVLLAEDIGGKVSIVTVDVDGVLVMLSTVDNLRRATRWCLDRNLRIVWSLGELMDELEAGRACGWVPGRIVEVKPRHSFVPIAVPFPYSLLVASGHAGPLECLDEDNEG